MNRPPLRSASMPVRIAAGLLALALTAGCSQRAQEAMLLLQDVAAVHGPSRLKERRETPQRRTVEISVGHQSVTADTYTLPQGSVAGMILVPGAAEAGRRDRRLTALAASLARVGFEVVVPDLTGVRDLKVGSENVTELVATVDWMVTRQPEGMASVGMGAFSYAVGPMLIAALDPAIADRVGFLFAVGGYHDVSRMATYVTTGWYEDESVRRYREPHPAARWAFLAGNAGRLHDADDRALLEEIAARRIDDPAAPIEDLVARLGAAGRSVYALLDNADPDRVPSLLESLPEEIRTEMAALDPSAHDLSTLPAEVILVHGRSDTIIPHTESESLARHLPSDRVSLYLVDGLFHVDVDFSVSDKLTLWDAAIDLLAARDRIASRSM